MANKLTYKDTLLKHIVIAIKSNYNKNKFLEEHIQPLNFLPNGERKKRIDALNIDLYDSASKLKLLHPEIFSNSSKQLNEGRFFYSELSNSVFIRCNSEQEFNELKALVSQFPYENSNYYTQQFCWLMKETFKKYEIAKNYELFLGLEDNHKEQDTSNNRLKEIWLAEAKISIEDFLRKGIDKGLWDEDNNILLKRGSLYGYNKTFLASLAVALKGYAISDNTDHKLMGEVFCDVFNIQIANTTKNPYKSFQTGKPIYIKLLKRQFGVI